VWPWEHVALAYVLLSAYARLVEGSPPDTGVAVAAGAGAVLPDLVDKPLAWTFGILPSGTSLAHSLLVAVPALLLLRWVAARRGRARLWAGFAVGYLSHLLGDVVYEPLLGGPVSAEFLLWPLIPARPSPPRGLFRYTSEYLAVFLQFLSTPRGLLYLGLDLLLLGAAVALWVADGAPGLPRPAARPRR